MVRLKIVNGKAEPVAKRMLWLAWKACGSPMGLGFLQDRSGVKEEDVWENARTAADYPFKPKCEAGEVSGDYVFGRMMKIYFKITEDEIEIPDVDIRPDYQAWSYTYGSYEALLKAAALELYVILTKVPASKVV